MEKTRPVHIYAIVLCNSAAAGRLADSSPKHGEVTPIQSGI